MNSDRVSVQIDVSVIFQLFLLISLWWKFFQKATRRHWNIVLFSTDPILWRTNIASKQSDIYKVLFNVSSLFISSFQTNLDPCGKNNIQWLIVWQGWMEEDHFARKRVFFHVLFFTSLLFYFQSVASFCFSSWSLYERSSRTQGWKKVKESQGKFVCADISRKFMFVYFFLFSSVIFNVCSCVRIARKTPPCFHWCAQLDRCLCLAQVYILCDGLQTLSPKLLNPQRWNDPRSRSLSASSELSVWRWWRQAPPTSWPQSVVNQVN